ncbi:kinase-like domain-containing protein [Rhizophagus irregularis DAOM 181602=DAOM 197198]|nr:kinase-like domain-containing protein [Rhizophagus irregularis DAOM 181602=DAOM 197198]
MLEWVPYSRITNLKEIAEGGYGKIYKASINGNIVAVKEFLNSQDPSKYFLNEIKSLYQCYDNKFEYIIKCHGITKNPMTDKFMFIMKYANGGDLHNYLQKNFTKITWKKKMHILWRISDGLQTIHEKDFIHRDFHSGLSQPANNTLSNNEIYGVIPYVAPEIFKGAAFSKASDIYSMGMIMWELTTGCKPFANIDEDDVHLVYKIIDGIRPEITDDTPEDFVNLIKKCWNPEPRKRPSAKRICESFNLWANMEKDVDQFNQAEEIRLELIQSKLLGPESIGKFHSKATYTSRPLSSFISTSTNTSMNSFKQGYVTKEYEIDINDIQRPSRDFIIENSNTQQVIYTSKPLSKLISEINPSRKRNIEDETQANGVVRKHVKISNEINTESQE